MSSTSGLSSGEARRSIAWTAVGLVLGLAVVGWMLRGYWVRPRPETVFDRFGGFRSEADRDPPNATIVSPTPGQSFRTGDSIDFRLEFDGQSQADLPTLIKFRLFWANQVEVAEVIPETVTGGKLQVVAKFTAPGRPGGYTIRADASDWPKSGPDAPSDPVNYRLGEVAIRIARK